MDTTTKDGGEPGIPWCAWHVGLQRGANAHKLTDVKGHVTSEHVEASTVTLVDKDGNDWADFFVDKGAVHYEGCDPEGPHSKLKAGLAKW